MPRRRSKENQGLPARWRHYHGAYYFLVPPGLEHLWGGKRQFRLGKTLPEAYRTWADRTEKEASHDTTVGALLDRYLLEVVPTKAAKTQTGHAHIIKRIRTVFGDIALTGIKPQHIYKYVDKRSRKVVDSESGRSLGGRTAALREVEVLSHVLTKAVEWGHIDKHPFKGEIRFQGTASRDRYVEDWEVVECLSLQSRRKKGSVSMIQSYIRIKLMTGMARGDLLRLQLGDLKEDGIHIQRHKTADKTGKRTIYAWNDELREEVARAKAARPALSSFLFCTRDGNGYIDEVSGTCSGWDSMWQRFMDRVLTETKVKERFTEHDLRAKAGSDAESIEHARALLSHADSRTTQAIYRRRAEIVSPLPAPAK